MKFAVVAAVAASLIVGGCSYAAKPIAVGSYNVYSSYDGKLPGKYLLYVEAAPLDRPIKPSDFNCSAHTFPLQLSGSFAESVRQTLTNVVAEIEVVQTPVDRTELAKRSARGMIVVRGESVDGRLRVVPGFWTAGIETDVEIVASITVDGKQGRLLGSTVSGLGHSQGDAGFACGGGGAALADAAGKSVEQTLTRLGEALVNSERVRGT